MSKPPFHWSQERIKTLREMTAAGHSASEIAATLGCDTRAIYNARYRYADRSGGSARLPSVETQADLQNYEVIGDKFIFAFEGRVITIDHDRMDRICADYSEYGGGMTQAELARTHGLPIPLIRRVLAAYGHYKSSPPYTRETTARAAQEGRLDALAEHAVEVQEAALIRKIEAQQTQRTLSRLRELESEDYRRRQILEAAAEAASRVAPFPSPVKALNRGQHWYCHAPTTDEHAGKSADPRAVYGPGYSTGEAVRRLREHADYLASWVASQPGRCKVIHRTFLGDLFESYRGTTVSGTPVGADASDADIWEQVLDAVLYAINQIRGVAEVVEVRMVPGNHDGDLVLMLASTVQRVFAAQRASDVVIHCHRMPYDYFAIGSSLHVLDHGRGYGALTGWKTRAQAEVNAREIAGADYARAAQIYTYVGHLHESQVAQLGSHHELIRLPALCENNNFETQLRFPGRGGARIFRLDDEGQITDEHRMQFGGPAVLHKAA